MRILLLNPPSFYRFDSAGARFQATRRTSSLWYPVWLAQATALIKESKLLDCPAENKGLEELLKIVGNYDMVAFYTSTPSIRNDVKVAEEIKKVDKKIKIIFTGPHVSVLAEETLNLSLAIDGVARREFEFTLLEISQGKDFSQIKGLSWRKNREVIHNKERELLMDLDKLPFVSPIYKRDLPIKKYHLPFTLWPYISIYTGRGCPFQCSFCLWPQTFTGRVYRQRSIPDVIEEVRYIKKEFPEIKEIFFDDDTFTIDQKQVLEFCQKISPLKITWSINARADVPLSVLKEMKKAGCRLLVVGYESFNQEILDNVKKNIKLEQIIEFTKNCQKTGLMIHGCFVFGLPGETKETMEKTLKFACQSNFDTIQVSVAMPLPGTEFYRYCKENNYLKEGSAIDSQGYQQCVVNYPHLSDKEIFETVEKAHSRYYFRLAYFLKLIRLSLGSYKEAQRIFLSGREYLKYLLGLWLSH